MSSSQQTLMERAKQFLPFMIMQIKDEDLEKLERDYKNREEADKVLLTMLFNPKEKWKELGVPDYMMKYDMEDEEEEEE